MQAFKCNSVSVELKQHNALKISQKHLWQFLMCAMYAALLRFAPRNWLTLSLSQAEVVDQVVKEAVDCKEKEEVGKASNNTN